MVTEALINYLRNESISINNKYKYLEELNLSYSDLFELKNIFVDNGRVNRIIHSFLAYNNNSFENKMKMQDRKLEKNKKMKEMRKIRRRVKHD